MKTCLRSLVAFYRRNGIVAEHICISLVVTVVECISVGLAVLSEYFEP